MLAILRIVMSIVGITAGSVLLSVVVAEIVARLIDFHPAGNITSSPWRCRRWRRRSGPFRCCAPIAGSTA